MKRLIFFSLIIILSLTTCPSKLEKLDKEIIALEKQLTNLDDQIRWVKYEVICNAKPYLVDVTITNKDGGTSQFAGVTAPWTHEFRSSSDAFVYISAQNQQDYGSVAATIYIKGKIFKTSTSSGAYVIATSSGSIP